MGLEITQTNRSHHILPIIYGRERRHLKICLLCPRPLFFFHDRMRSQGEAIQERLSWRGSQGEALREKFSGRGSPGEAIQERSLKGCHPRKAIPDRLSGRKHPAEAIQEEAI